MNPTGRYHPGRNCVRQYTRGEYDSDETEVPSPPGTRMSTYRKRTSIHPGATPLGTVPMYAGFTPKGATLTLPNAVPADTAPMHADMAPQGVLPSLLHAAPADTARIRANASPKGVPPAHPHAMGGVAKPAVTTVDSVLLTSGTALHDSTSTGTQVRGRRGCGGPTVTTVDESVLQSLSTAGVVPSSLGYNTLLPVHLLELGATQTAGLAVAIPGTWGAAIPLLAHLNIYPLVTLVNQITVEYRERYKCAFGKVLAIDDVHIRGCGREHRWGCVHEIAKECGQGDNDGGTRHDHGQPDNSITESSEGNAVRYIKQGRNIGCIDKDTASVENLEEVKTHERTFLDYVPDVDKKCADTNNLLL
eukprot:CAMPEP_0194295684 /NCGR_PEP_ID=MMETSP0169-20130528/54042_1 /TAXON_ID=218684 /ORGANISM="Corethron pennatum, Strain L29A3" /LENGTH=360 /DNA_ID=CAMNT_0039044911 /DNA_START=42 /DNA_END=1124 /DNA_ORIENTATION=-